MARARKTPRISILNWMGTLLLCAIPGVNIIALICFIIFGKSASKKNFAWAALILMLLAVVIAAVLLLVLPEQAAELERQLRIFAAQSAVPAATPMP